MYFLPHLRFGSALPGLFGLQVGLLIWEGNAAAQAFALPGARLH